MRPWQKLQSCLTLLVALVATLCRTTRGPNDWAEAHWLLDYRFGFVKRGLAGQLLTWLAGLFGRDVDEAAIALVAFAAYGTFCLLLLAIALRVVQRAAWSPASVAAMVAFLCSPFLVMTGHLVGYLDHVFLSLGIASVWLALRGKVLAGALVQTVALFVHESCIVLIFPAFALAVALHGTRRGEWWPLLLPIAVAALLGRFIGAPPPGFTVLYAGWLGQHAFVEQGFDTLTPDLLSWTLAQFWAVVSPRYGERMANPGSIGLVLPTLFVLLAWLQQRARLGLLSLPAIVVAAVVLLPQAMHLLAWDLERIWTFSLWTMFVVVWIYSEVRPEDGPEAAVLPLALLAIAANFVIETPLMDLEFDHMPRGVRVGILLALVLSLLVLAAARSPKPWRERLRWRG